MKTFGITDYTNKAPQKCCRRTDRQTAGRTDGRTDERSGPTTRTAFAQATQVITFNDNTINVNSSYLCH